MFFFLLVTNIGAANEVLYLDGARTAEQAQAAAAAEQVERHANPLAYGGAACVSVVPVAVKAKRHGDALLLVARGEYAIVAA